MLVHSLLECTSRRFSDKPAVWERGEWMSYGQIEGQANRVANFLVAQGLQRGERVTLLMENSCTFITAYFGIMKAGGVVVGLNTEITSEDLEYLVQNSDARFLFLNKERLRLYEPIKAKLGGLHSVVVSGGVPQGGGSDYVKFESIAADYPAELDAAVAKNRPIDIDLAEIVYTSGSTGVPKGVMLSHLNLSSNMQSIAEYLHLTSDDRIMVILPFTYIYGKSLLLTHVLVGGSMVIDNRFAYPNKVLETMQTTEATGFAGVPSTFSILLNRSSLRDYSFPQLRYVTQAGGHMAPAQQKEALEAFYPAQLYIMYGATEAAPRLSYLEPAMLLPKLGSIG
ncbi:MAG: AMP-binding protein, partial [Spirochaetota bacterium]